MMNIVGRIELDRELTYTQSQKLLNFFNNPPKERRYSKIHFDITTTGRSIQWNKNEDIDFIEQAAADTIAFLRLWKINSIGVLRVVRPEKKVFEIVILRDKVKVIEDGHVRNISPSESI